ncbi:MAG TPA: hypothetical protein VGE93_22040 [Bryobacteraceae bacterium]
MRRSRSATAGIAEMLLQSHAGELRLLPALPTAWADGSVRSLRGRGGYSAELLWADGKLREVELVTSHGGVCRLHVPHAAKLVVYGQDGTPVETTASLMTGARNSKRRKICATGLPYSSLW